MESSIYKGIFTENEDIRKNAYMNWRMDSYDQRHNFKAIADGYMSSSLLMIESCLKDNVDNKADGFIFPILFNAIQAIELYMKAIIWTMHLILWLNDNEDNGKNYPKNHKLDQLFNELKSLVRRCEPETLYKEKDFNEEMRNLKNYIDELYTLPLDIDKDINAVVQFARYPVSKKGSPFFYASESSHNVIVDLDNYYIRINQIWNSLQNCYFAYDKYLDDKIDYLVTIT